MCNWKHKKQNEKHSNSSTLIWFCVSRKEYLERERERDNKTYFIFKKKTCVHNGKLFFKISALVFLKSNSKCTRWSLLWEIQLYILFSLVPLNIILIEFQNCAVSVFIRKNVPMLLYNFYSKSKLLFTHTANSSWYLI